MSFALAAALAAAQEPCRPEGRSLALDGTLDREVGEDASGRPERYPVLRLEAPICVAVAPLDGPAPEEGVVVDTLQLVGPAARVRELLEREPGPVALVGRPWAGLTAHHHTAVLLGVDAVGEARWSGLAGCVGDCDPAGDEAENGVAGGWRVVGHVGFPVSAWSHVEADAYDGARIEVGAGLESPWGVCAAASWRRVKWSREAWLADVGLAPPDPTEAALLGLGGGGVEVWEGRCADGGELALALPSPGHLVLIVDGAAFALRR